MTQIGLLGDLHSNKAAIKVALEVFRRIGITEIYQVGDFGIYQDTHSLEYLKLARLLAERNGQTIRITPGNHEDWDWINEMHADPKRQRDDGWTSLRGDSLLIAPRALRWSVDDVVFMSLGGAPSVDRGWRVRDQGANPPKHRKLWHEGEMITLEDAQKAIDPGPVDIMLAHDAPYGVTSIERKIGPNPLRFDAADLIYARGGRDLMRQVTDAVRPRVFVGGHYHFQVNEEIRLPGGDWMHVMILEAELSRWSMGVLDTTTRKAGFLNWNSVMAGPA